MQSHQNLWPSIDAAAEEQERRTRDVAVRANMVRRGEVPIEAFSPTHQAAVREYLARNSASEMTPQQFHAKQEAERRTFFKIRAAQGHKPHRVSQHDHDFIVGSIFGSVDAGTKPAVRRMLQAYGEEHGYAAEWANRVSARTQPKKMARTLAAKKDHPVLKDLKEGHMLSQTHKATLQNATYSGLAELLFSGSQSVRSQRRTQERIDALEAELAAVKAEAARANARLDIKDAGKDWKEVARSVLAAEPTISNRELARRVGKSETAIRKYLSELRA